jgi:hypothetical protein
MAKLPLKWIVTGNFTASGGVAYLRADGGYGGSLTDAQLFETKDEAEAARQTALGAERVVSDPYLTEVGVAPQGLDALSARERIRQHGPTIRVRRPDSGPTNACS